MPTLDVGEILTDPEFVDMTLVCVRNMQTVGSDGLAVNAPQNFQFAGVVTNDSGDILERLATGERIKGSILIITRFALLSGSPTSSADVIKWNGDTYTVSNVAAYSKYGRGFVQASCDLLPLTG